jgi:hypothetical protein
VKICKKGHGNGLNILNGFLKKYPSCACKWQKLLSFDELSHISQFLSILMTISYQHPIFHGRWLF